MIVMIRIKIMFSQRMPILRAFCLFCAVGVFFLYVFAATFFAG